MEMSQVVFIVWRESIEALLIVGILYTWLSQHSEGHRGLKYLWAGVSVGIALAMVMGYGILALGDALDGDAQEYFQIAMVLIASILIIHMVRWMRRHGKNLKREMETDLGQNVAQKNWWGVLVLAMIAVFREGSETVVFLYGMGLGAPILQVALYALLGFLLAFFTYFVLQLGNRFFSWQRFFRVTEILLLFLAAALLTTAVEKLIAMGVLPGIVDPVWDTSWLLDGMSITGGLASSFLGYRAQPALLTIIIYVLYWLTLPWLLRIKKTGPRAKSC